MACFSYSRCRPEKPLVEGSGGGWGLVSSALVSLVTGHKPRVLMFGPGLDSRTSKLVRSILADPASPRQPSRFAVTGMVPGAFAGSSSPSSSLLPPSHRGAGY